MNTDEIKAVVEHHVRTLALERRKNAMERAGHRAIGALRGLLEVGAIPPIHRAQVRSILAEYEAVE